MKDRSDFRNFVFVSLLAWMTGLAFPEAKDRLELGDGGVLSGQLEGISSDGKILWKHPGAEAPIQFQSSGISQIVFSGPVGRPNDSFVNSLIRFVNGDVIHAKLLSLSDEQVELDTWFAGRLGAPRGSLASLTFLEGNGRVLYEGPMKQDHWTAGAMPMRWQVSEGTLTATNSGYIARDFILPKRVKVEFHAKWTGPFAILMGLFCEDIQSFNVRNGYRFSIGANSTSLQRMELGQPTKYLGQLRYTEDPLGEEASFEFRCDRGTGLIHMIVDGKVLQTFEDPVGVPGRGNAISFYWQRAGAPLEITGFRISEWNGVMEDLRQDDMDGGHRKIRLVNKDSFEGEVMEIRDEQARLKTPFLEFEVPIRRISHLEFVPSVTNLTGFENGQVRAWFENRGSLSLAVEDFKSDRVVGTNPNLGRIRLNPEWMDRLQFNPMNESPGDEGRLPEIDDPDWPEE